jgi:hypothetical protein
MGKQNNTKQNMTVHETCYIAAFLMNLAPIESCRISAFDRRQARQKRSYIRSIHGHVSILRFFASLWLFIIVADPDAPDVK